VVVDPDGRLGTVLTATGPDLGGFSPDGGKAIPQSTGPDTMLNTKVEELQKQVETLTAQLKEQAAQIQKVSAQLEASKPAPKVVSNK
jgi:septal ring factor EnvC (AmiA/AmiB activator)